MSFARQTSAFFDELSNIADEQQKQKDQQYQDGSSTPFSSQLTQDEEPTEYRPANPATPPNEQEVIMGGQGG